MCFAIKTTTLEQDEPLVKPIDASNTVVESFGTTVSALTFAHVRHVHKESNPLLNMAPITKAIQKRLEANVAAFNTRYADHSQWGEERWSESLYPALGRSTMYTAVINQYAINEEEALSILPSSDTGVLRRVELPPVSGSGSEQRKEGQGVKSPEIICFERAPISKIYDNGAGTEAAKLSLAGPFPVPKAVSPTSGQLMTHWNMDAASVLAAHMLDVHPGDRVLDMCAAPGGKSVVLAQKLFPHARRDSSLEVESAQESALHVNEFDHIRFKRLSTNLKSYLDPSLFNTLENPQAPIKLLNKDLSAKQSFSMLPLGAGGYDKILIDAPCSSERHIIHAYEKAKASGQVADEMLNWKSSHVTTLTKTQAGLLQTALKAVKTGGRIVYATCALGEEENDGVIAKVLDTLKADRKRAKRDNRQNESWDVSFMMGAEGNGADVDNPVLDSMTERTKYGRIALPDHGGWGPLYFSIMIKTVRTKKSRHNSNNGVSTTPLLEQSEAEHGGIAHANVSTGTGVQDLQPGQAALLHVTTS